MTSDFFVRLTMATHKVADILPKQDPLRSQMQDCANKLLASLILLAKENPVTKEQKRTVTPKAIRELGVLIAYLNYAKRMSKLNPENFLILEREYNKVGEFLRRIHETQGDFHGSAGAPPKSPAEAKQLASAPQPPDAAFRRSPSSAPLNSSLSTRQTRILALMRNKPKVQVWELQKVFGEVTKRTLRRDLDSLLNLNFIVRKGEWNEVFYQIR